MGCKQSTWGKPFALPYSCVPDWPSHFPTKSRGVPHEQATVPTDCSRFRHRFRWLVCCLAWRRRQGREADGREDRNEGREERRDEGREGREESRQEGHEGREEGVLGFPQVRPAGLGPFFLSDRAPAGISYRSTCLGVSGAPARDYWRRRFATRPRDEASRRHRHRRTLTPGLADVS
ncbi:MAG TPA: hypothetical protein DHV85_01360 [Candidatus Accumulibacter sp.]|nr:hypothetical protein [Accumulibacter sp.]